MSQTQLCEDGNSGWKLLVSVPGYWAGFIDKWNQGNTWDTISAGIVFQQRVENRARTLHNSWHILCFSVASELLKNKNYTYTQTHQCRFAWLRSFVFRPQCLACCNDNALQHLTSWQVEYKIFRARRKASWGLFIWARVYEINLSPVNRYEKGARRLQYKLRMAPRELISIVPLVVALSTRLTSLLQLNGIPVKWKIWQIRQDTATEAAKRSFSCAKLKHFHPGQPGWRVHMSPVKIPVAETEISVDRNGPVFIWTHRNFYKVNSGRARSRSNGLI